jgi:LysM repeat protein
MERNQERNNPENNQAPDSNPENEKKTGGIVSEYIAEEKDTLTDIARRYGMSIDEILAANPGLNEPADLVRPGMKIKIPKKLN